MRLTKYIPLRDAPTTPLVSPEDKTLGELNLLYGTHALLLEQADVTGTFVEHNTNSTLGGFEF